MSDRTRELECVISDLMQQARDAERERVELLEALKLMVELVDLVVPFEGASLRRARAAIARATGEQP